jgi:hypothetical protein
MVTTGSRAAHTMITAFGVIGIRKIVFGEFLSELFLSEESPHPRLPWIFRRMIFSLVTRPCFKRATLGAQVLAKTDREGFARAFRDDRGIFCYLPWPLVHKRRERELSANRQWMRPAHPIVMASGHAALDWEVFFQMARGQDWDLVVICGKRDMALVERLNSDGRAKVYCDVPPEQHQELLNAATVYVLPLREIGMSAGQVRLMLAVTSRVPVVATRVTGLADYIEDGRTARTVPPGDVRAMRDAVLRVIEKTDETAAMVEAAYTRGLTHTWEDYLASWNRFVLSPLELQTRNPGTVRQHETAVDEKPGRSVGKA